MSILRMKEYLAGMKAGMPVCMGYFSVSFGFGAMAVKDGLTLWQAVLISVSNLTSAGQVAGLEVIVAAEGLLAMILTQLVINSRYALMSVALGPKFGPGVGTGRRLVAAFFNTDEIFALGMTRQEKLTPGFFIGAGTVAAIGWTTGTAMGAFASSLLPTVVQAALGVMLYGMFIAIVVPQARQEKTILLNMVLALVFSCLFTWVPVLNRINGGMAIVISTVAAATISAVAFPVEQEVAQ